MTSKAEPENQALPPAGEQRTLQEAEAIASILEKHPDLARDLLPTLQAAAWLEARREAIDPRPGYISASRHRLVAELSKPEPERKSIRRKSGRSGPWWNGAAVRVVLVVLLALALLANTQVLSAAAKSAYPGDPLYALKKVEEKLQLAVSFSVAGDARLRLLFTQRRAVEISNLIFEGRFEHIHNAAQDFERQTCQAIELIEILAEDEPEEAYTLAAALESMLSGQAMYFRLLARMVPSYAYSGLELAIQASEEGAHAAQLTEQSLADRVSPPEDASEEEGDAE